MTADSGAGVIDARRLSLIDFSHEDDQLIDTSPVRLVGPQFLDDRSLDSLQGLDSENTDDQRKNMASTNVERLEEKATKTPENYHLRESLAWDTAFFTSDGVLEAEELTSMIKDAENKETHALPTILEETQRSTESISTFASDTLTLASFEGELFEDIRASIQKTSKTSRIQSFGGKAGQSPTEAYINRSSRKADTCPVSHGNKMPTPRKSSTGTIRPGKTTNQALVHQRVSQVRSDAVGGNPSSNPLPSKPPKPGMVSPMPSSTKRVSMGVKHKKPEKIHIETAGGQDSESKVSVSSGTCSTEPGSSSSRSSSSDSSDKTRKSRMNLQNKGVDSRSTKVSSASSFTVKTPPNSTLSHLSTHVVSATKLSSSISPTSSIYEWSSESSSSTSAVKKRSNDSKASLEPSSLEKTCDDDGGSRKQLDGPKTQGPSSSTECLKNASSGGTLHLPNSMGHSRIRMPSPKIGFFDGTKSTRTPKVNLQHSPGICSDLLDVGSEISKPDGPTNKPKIVKSQAVRTAITVGRKSDPKNSFSGQRLKSLLPDSSNSLENVKHSYPSISRRLKNSLPPKIGQWNQLKAEQGKSKESSMKTCDEKESPGAHSGMEDAVDMVNGSMIPVERDIPVENGLVADQSFTGCTSKLASEELLSMNLLYNQSPPSNCKLKPLPSSPSTGARQPFAAINSLCNMNDSCDVLAGMDSAELGNRINLPCQGP
ncbi:hypothetical protein SAY86_014948 [Trapa natans]|uniref:Uncharacterized protein n=1 Tax=Trapa natans TaxID=22666 RepID=A0AAN7KM58_TRANT|nr:hypothetical protein SAY86_014948 [Trapa natans]